MKQLAEPISLPKDYVPYVHNRTEAPKELVARALEASRIAPALPWRSLEHLLDEPASSLRKWPPGTLALATIEALSSSHSAARMAEWRRHLVNLNDHMCHAYCTPNLHCLQARVGAQVLKDYLKGRLEADSLRKAATLARKGDTSCSGLPVSPASQSGSAAAALSALASAATALNLDINTSHPTLDQYRTRPKTREDGGAVDPEPLLVIFLELGAADTCLSMPVRGGMALLANAAHLCVRKALGARSRRARRVEGEHAIGGAGCDLK